MADLRNKIRKHELNQKMIDTYEHFIPNVYEAIRFVREGSGKKYHGAFDTLLQIINQHEKEMWRKLEEVIFEEENHA